MANLVAPDGTTFELAEGETLLGRGEREVGDPPKVNLGPLSGGPTVSRQHARLRQDREQWYVEAERQSTNTTLVDGLSVPRGMSMPIHDGAQLQLGDVHMIFRGPSISPDVEADTLEADDLSAPSANGRLVSVVPPGMREVASWVARLPGRAAVFETVAPSLKRVNPFEGLMVDETTWSDEQQYHRDAARIHQLANHGWGIVEGLEVTVDSLSNTVVVHSGVAIDPLGRLLLVPRDVRLGVPSQTGQRWYVALAFAEQPILPQSAWDGSEHATRVVESVTLSLVTQIPTSPSVELARFVTTDVLRDAVDPTNPQPGEVDLRYRERQLVRPRPDLGIVQLSGESDQASVRHRLGLRFLAREIGHVTNYRPRWAGVVELGEPLPQVAMAYLTGDGAFTLDANGVNRMRGFLNGGGVLFADACAEGRPAEFADSVAQLANQLDVALETVERWHPVLIARHVLAVPTQVLEGGGIVLSRADYGCAWQGGSENAPIARQSIRDALEIGTNVAVYGQQRRRPLDLLDFEA
jgi:hypothetical protein